MTVDIKGIGSAIRGQAGADEAKTTIHVKSEVPDGSLTLSVDPEGEVEMTFCMRSGDSSVAIHGREAMVQGASGDLRYYMLEMEQEGLGVVGPEGESEGDAMLIRSAKAMFDQVLNSIEVEDLKKFNPFEEGTN